MPRRTRLLPPWTILCGVFFLAMPILHAQIAGHVDPSFGASLGLAGHVKRVLVQPDGKILVGGSFKKGIVRLNPNGGADMDFDPGAGADSEVDTMVQQADGKLVISGDFANVNGVARNHIARLNADGSLDPGFDPGVGPNYSIFALAVRPDGKVVIGGNFSSVDGVARNHIARLNADGSLDAGFDPVTGVSDVVNALSVQANGKVVVSRYFMSVDNFSHNPITRFNADGSVDADFNPGAEANEDVDALVVQTDGKVVIGGYFNSVNGVARNGIARLNADGSLDTGFDPGAGANSSVSALVVQTDGKVVIGGYFNSVNGVARNGIARLNADGSLDTGFDPGAGADKEVNAVAVQTNGKVVIGGYFNNVNGVARNGIARLNADGSLDDALQVDTVPGPNNAVSALAVQTDGKVVIGGPFTTVGGVARNGIARLNADGSLDTGFDPGAGVNGDVLAMAVQTDGKIVITGQFTTVGGVTRIFIARLNSNGSLDTGFDPGETTDGYIYALAVRPDGKVVIGGIFTNIGGTARHSVARLNPNGSVDTGFDPGEGVNGLYHTVDALAQQADGKLVIGGDFTNVDGTTRNHIARLNADGSLDTGFDPGSGANGNVLTVALQTDGKVVIGGLFTNVGGMARLFLARLDTDGSVDPGFNPGSEGSYGIGAVAVQADGKIVIEGSITGLGGVTRNIITRLNADGSVDMGFNSGSGANDGVSALIVQANGKVVIGGAFNSVGGSVRNYVARLDGDGSVDPDFVPGGGIPTVVALTLQSDNRVVVGGSFSDVAGKLINALARLNTDGSLDGAFSPGLPTGDTVDAVALQPDDGNVLAADVPAATLPVGSENLLPHTQTKIKNPIIRCNKLTGAIDAAYHAVTDGRTFAIVGLSGRQALIGGGFGYVNDTAHPGLALLKADGSLDASFVGTTNGPVRGLTLSSANGGTVIAGGGFTTVDGVARNHVARLFANGNLDMSFDPGVGPDGSVNAVRALDNGQVLIGGSFANVDGVPRDGVARLNANGSLDTSFPADTASRARKAAVAATVTVNSFDVQTKDGKIVIGGSFSQIGGLTRPNVARLNADGSVDTGFNPGTGTNAAVNALKLQPDGRTLLGGGFSSVDGLERRGAARLLGDMDVAQTPVVTVTVAGDNSATEGGGKVKVFFQRTGDTSGALTVSYKVKGTAKAGVDYKELPGTVTIPAGATKKKIKIKPLENDVHDGTTKAKIKLLPASDGSYIVGDPFLAKVKIIDND